MYFSFEEAADNKIVVKGRTVTYSDENGGQITFDRKCQWSMVGTGTITYQPGRPADFNFVNQYTEKPISLDVVKVSEKTNDPLPGAVFGLRKILDLAPTEGGTYATDTSFAVQTLTTGGAGTATATGLTPGYYELRETAAPAGYLLMPDDTTVYFKVDGGVVTWLQKGEGKPSDWASPGTSSLVSFAAAAADDPETEADESTNAAFTVKNRPGQALPNTGGAGAEPLRTLGAALTAFGAGALLLRRRKKKHA